MNIKKILLNIGIFAFMLLPVVSLAVVEGGNIGFDNPLTNEQMNLGDVIGKVVDFVLKVASVVVVLYIIYSGFLFVTAQGKDDKISQAKKTFFWAIVGALIILGARVLASVVCSTAVGLGATNLGGVCK